MRPLLTATHDADVQNQSRHQLEISRLEGLY